MKLFLPLLFFLGTTLYVLGQTTAALVTSPEQKDFSVPKTIIEKINKYTSIVRDTAYAYFQIDKCLKTEKVKSIIRLSGEQNYFFIERKDSTWMVALITFKKKLKNIQGMILLEGKYFRYSKKNLQVVGYPLSPIFRTENGDLRAFLPTSIFQSFGTFYLETLK